MGRRYSVDPWRSLLAAQAASGISISLFWEAKDIPEKSFYYWRKKLESDTSVESELNSPFIPVSVVQQAGLEVRFPSGVTMQVPCDRTAIGLVVDVLQQQEGDDEC